MSLAPVPFAYPEYPWIKGRITSRDGFHGYVTFECQRCGAIDLRCYSAEEIKMRSTHPQRDAFLGKHGGCE